MPVFVFTKSQILTSDKFAIYQIAYFSSSIFVFRLKLRYVKCQMHFLRLTYNTYLLHMKLVKSQFLYLANREFWQAPFLQFSKLQILAVAF